MDFFVRNDTDFPLLRKINIQSYHIWLIMGISLISILWFYVLYMPLQQQITWYISQNNQLQQKITLIKKNTEPLKTNPALRTDAKKQLTAHEALTFIQKNQIKIKTFTQKKDADPQKVVLTIIIEDTFTACKEFLDALAKENTFPIREYQLQKNNQNNLIILTLILHCSS